MRDAFNTELNCIASNDESVLLLTADIGFQVFDEFRENFPDRFYNVGVAEANMLGMATGLTLSNKKVFVYTIIPFLTMRAFEQIRTDVCIMNQPVKIVGVGGGLSYGTLGPTHHSIVDLAILRSLPNMTVVCPCDPIESMLATRAATNYPGPIYIRLGKNGEDNLHTSEYDFQIGKSTSMRNGNDAVIISCGPVTGIALEAAEKLELNSIDVGVQNMHTLKPIDKREILSIAKKTSLIITLEEHNIIGGLGSAVSEIISEMNCDVSVKRIGIRDNFCYGVGSQQYHLNKNGISVEGIENIILSELNK
tara:strand:+ start:314 stop:1234 length:921 start_codon:yes stop_codon:yes gene_type:complete